MKLLSWNVNRAGPPRHALWETFLREAPDIALLQELGGLPSSVRDRYQSHIVTPRYFEAGEARFRTAILSRFPLDTSPFLSSELEWVNDIHRQQPGWIVEGRVTPAAGEEIHVVSVHSPAFHVPWESLKGRDVSTIKLRNNPKLWFTEILWSLLRQAETGSGTNWIVAGDFNSSLLFDIPKDKGNAEVVERMTDLGFVDALSWRHGGPLPTFQHPGGKVDHQLDYCYVNPPMLQRLASATVLPQDEVFGPTPRLSDHLPVVCELV